MVEDMESRKAPSATTMRNPLHGTHILGTHYRNEYARVAGGILAEAAVETANRVEETNI